MSYLEALIMGIIQGLTEFLPVSSSAHLKLIKLVLGIDTSDQAVIFDLVCHLGTLSALIFFLWKDLRGLWKTDRQKLKMLLIAMAPLFPFYFLFKPFRDWASQSSFLGLFLIVTGIILFIGGRLRLKRAENLTFKNRVGDALWIGTMQSTALIPGISRSASTISCARILGWESKDAVRFSFLLSIPTILGGNGAEMVKLLLSRESSPVSLGACLVAFLSSCGVGFLIIRIAVPFLEKGNLKPFAWYCLLIGLLTHLFFL